MLTYYNTDKAKLKKAIGLSTQNICREILTEIEIFTNTAKAFVDSPKRAASIDKALSHIRNRIFDIGGEESRRMGRFLEGWKVEQIDNYDWVEFGNRLDD